MATLHIQLLGDFRLALDNQPLTSVNSPRLQSLLAYLLLHRDAPQARQQIAFALWTDSTEANARNNLRQLLFDLRRALPDADQFLTIENSTAQWHANASFTLDVDAFQHALADAAHQATAAPRCNALAKAIELYRGDLLPGCYDEWLALPREHLRDQFIAALDQLIDLEESLDLRSAIQHCQQLLQHDPLHESTYRRLMRLYAATGDRASALRVYHTCATVLKRELDAEPSAETRQAFAHLQTARIDTPSAPPQSRVNNLPQYATSFVGRQNELAELQNLWHTAAPRLLTLTGAGGCGKTRLALQFAGELANAFADGVWFIDLAALSEPRLIPAAMASVFHLPQHAQRPAIEIVTNYLRAKKLTLVFDNCEHLHQAAGQIVKHLIDECPGVKILATSRRKLDVENESVWRVPSLTLPDENRLAASDAVQLFVERANLVLPTFTLNAENLSAVEQICRRVDGIPLAIELAAARIAMLAPQQIAARLGDAFQLLTRGKYSTITRHQTLQATLDWSYGLLAEKERRLFQRLAVFVGGFTLEAVEQICNDETPSPIRPGEILNLLSQLIDQSLVAVQQREHGAPARYRLLEPLWQYARKFFDAGDAGEFQKRHAHFFARWAEDSEPKLKQVEQTAWLERFDDEHANLRAALEWSHAHQDTETCLRLVAALWLYWQMRAHFAEADIWFARAVAADDAEKFPVAFANTLNYAGALAWLRGDYTAARTALHRSLALAQNIGAAGDGARTTTMYWLAITEMRGNNFARARELALASENLARQLHNTWDVGHALYAQGRIALEAGDIASAGALGAACCAVYRELGDRWQLALALTTLGSVAMKQANYLAAQSIYEESLALRGELNDKWSIAASLTSLGEVEHIQDHIDRAEKLYQENLRLSRELGNTGDVARALHNLGFIALRRGDAHNANAQFRSSLLMFRELGIARGIAECLLGFAGAGRDATRQVTLLAASENWFAHNHVSRWHADQVEYNRLLETMRGKLNESQFTQAWAAGSALSLEQAAERALNL